VRELFGEYYRPSDKDFSQLWQDGTFVFDTNVLLHFYRYTPSARDELLSIIESLKDRVWLPHQVGLEFSRDRISVILDQNKIFDLTNMFDTFVRDNVENKILQKYRKSGHSFADLEKIREILQQAKQALQEELQKARAQHPDPMEHDQLLDRLDAIFMGRIGSPYSEDEMTDLSKKFEKRYKEKIPPGYKDAKKNNINKDQEDQKDDANNPANIYGDVLLWFQVIDYAKQEKRPIILVVDDNKEDWWEIRSGKKLGPRIELRREMQKEANVPFYIYDANNFIQKASGYLKAQVSKETIDEVREISMQDAKKRKESSALTYQLGASLSPLYTTGIQNTIGQAIPSIGQAIPSIGLQDLARHVQSTNQIINSLGGLSQLNQSLRISQNLYRQIQPFFPHSEQQQDDEENQEESLNLEENEQDKKDNSSDDNALDDTEN